MLPTSPPKTIKEEVAEIIHLWNKPASRHKAKQRLEALGPPAIPQLLLLLQEETEANRRRKRRWIHYMVALTIAYTVIIVVPHLWLERNPLQWLSPLFTLLPWLPILSGKSSETAAQLLAEYEDIRIVGPLIEALSLTNNREAIIKPLLRLLPQMKASDAYLLTPTQRNILYRELDSWEKPFVLAILKSLEQIGDGKAVSYVEKLAHPLFIFEVSAEVQEAARACLPFLRERAEKEQLHSTLLRASDATQTQPDQLLRPAAANTETDPTVLLRATHQER